MSYLHNAVLKKDYQCLESLLREGLNVDTRDEYGATTAHVCAFMNDTSALQLLINYGSNISLHMQTVLNNHSWTPLHIACWRHQAKVATFLLEQGADANCQDECGCSPLHVATQSLQPQSVERYRLICRKLKNYGVNANSRSQSGYTALHYAVKQPMADDEQQRVQAPVVCFMLQELGVDINAVTNYGQSALWFAVQAQNEFTLQTLIAAGAHLHTQDINGNTALHIAISTNNINIVKQILLVNDPCSVQQCVNILNKNGASPLDLAYCDQCSEMIQLLTSHGAHSQVGMGPKIAQLSRQVSQQQHTKQDDVSMSSLYKSLKSSCDMYGKDSKQVFQVGVGNANQSYIVETGTSKSHSQCKEASSSLKLLPAATRTPTASVSESCTWVSCQGQTERSIEELLYTGVLSTRSTVVSTGGNIKQPSQQLINNLKMLKLNEMDENEKQLSDQNMARLSPDPTMTEEILALLEASLETQNDVTCPNKTNMLNMVPPMCHSVQFHAVQDYNARLLQPKCPASDILSQPSAQLENTDSPPQSQQKTKKVVTWQDRKPVKTPRGRQQQCQGAKKSFYGESMTQGVYSKQYPKPKGRRPSTARSAPPVKWYRSIQQGDSQSCEKQKSRVNLGQKSNNIRMPNSARAKQSIRKQSLPGAADDTAHTHYEKLSQLQSKLQSRSTFRTEPQNRGLLPDPCMDLKGSKPTSSEPPAYQQRPQKPSVETQSQYINTVIVNGQELIITRDYDTAAERSPYTQLHLLPITRFSNEQLHCQDHKSLQTQICNQNQLPVSSDSQDYGALVSGEAEMTTLGPTVSGHSLTLLAQQCREQDQSYASQAIQQQSYNNFNALGFTKQPQSTAGAGQQTSVQSFQTQPSSAVAGFQQNKKENKIDIPLLKLDQIHNSLSDMNDSLCMEECEQKEICSMQQDTKLIDVYTNQTNSCKLAPYSYDEHPSLSASTITMEQYTTGMSSALQNDESINGKESLVIGSEASYAVIDSGLRKQYQDRESPQNPDSNLIQPVTNNQKILGSSEWMYQALLTKGSTDLIGKEFKCTKSPDNDLTDYLCQRAQSCDLPFYPLENTQNSTLDASCSKEQDSDAGRYPSAMRSKTPSASSLYKQLVHQAAQAAASNDERSINSITSSYSLGIDTLHSQTSSLVHNTDLSRSQTDQNGSDRFVADLVNNQKEQHQSYIQQSKQLGSSQSACTTSCAKGCTKTAQLSKSDIKLPNAGGAQTYLNSNIGSTLCSMNRIQMLRQQCHNQGQQQKYQQDQPSRVLSQCSLTNCTSNKVQYTGIKRSKSLSNLNLSCNGPRYLSLQVLQTGDSATALHTESKSTSWSHCNMATALSHCQSSPSALLSQQCSDCSDNDSAQQIDKVCRPSIKSSPGLSDNSSEVSVFLPILPMSSHAVSSKYIRNSVMQQYFSQESHYQSGKAKLEMESSTIAANQANQPVNSADTNVTPIDEPFILQRCFSQCTSQSGANNMTYSDPLPLVDIAHTSGTSTKALTPKSAAARKLFSCSPTFPCNASNCSQVDIANDQQGEAQPLPALLSISLNSSPKCDETYNRANGQPETTLQSQFYQNQTQIQLPPLLVHEASAPRHALFRETRPTPRLLVPRTNAVKPSRCQSLGSIKGNLDFSCPPPVARNPSAPLNGIEQHTSLLLCRDSKKHNAKKNHTGTTKQEYDGDFDLDYYEYCEMSTGGRRKRRLNLGAWMHCTAPRLPSSARHALKTPWVGDTTYSPTNQTVNIQQVQVSKEVQQFSQQIALANTSDVAIEALANASSKRALPKTAFQPQRVKNSQFSFQNPHDERVKQYRAKQQEPKQRSAHNNGSGFKQRLAAFVSTIKHGFS